MDEDKVKKDRKEGNKSREVGNQIDCGSLGGLGVLISMVPTPRRSESTGSMDEDFSLSSCFVKQHVTSSLRETF